MAITLGLYAVMAAVARQAWRLAVLLAPYLIVAALLAVIWSHAEGPPVTAAAPDGWLVAHIIVSVVTYGLLTLSAVAGLASFLQERALKRKSPTALTRRLPAVLETEALSNQTLAATAVVLGLGIVSGMSVQLMETGALMKFDHKTLLSVLTFVVISVLLIVQKVTGMRGRAAARVVLVAFLLLTLAFPGVKFVTDVLLG